MKRLLPTLVLVVFLIVAVLPLVAVGSFGFFNERDGFTIQPIVELFSSSKAVEAVVNSAILTVLTVALGYAIVIPTLVWMHLRVPKALGAAETDRKSVV